jgi:hypothetical protein
MGDRREHKDPRPERNFAVADRAIVIAGSTRCIADRR